MKILDQVMCRLLFCQNAAELLYMNCDRIQALRTALILSRDILKDDRVGSSYYLVVAQLCQRQMTISGNVGEAVTCLKDFNLG